MGIRPQVFYELRASADITGRIVVECAISAQLGR